jgi:hypothetical protein
MSESELGLLQGEVHRLQRAVRNQRLLSLGCLLATTGLAITILGRPESVVAQSTPDKDGIIHVRGLIVEDRGGHERLRLGAPLPDPMIHGVRQKRQGVVSGMVISDANGNERGGYVTEETSGGAFLSLDSEDEQKVLLLANPKGGVNFILSNNDGNFLQFTAVPEGPKFTMKKAHQTVLELPTIPK